MDSMQAPKDRTQELTGQTVKSIYAENRQVRILFENGLDVMILPKCIIRDFDGITPLLNIQFVEKNINPPTPQDNK